MTNNTSAPERVLASFRQLSTSAKNLNNASDELRDTISAFDAALKKLNLGISAWVRISGDEDANGEYWSRDIGYAKVGDTWGIALRDITGNHDVPEAGYTTHEEWLFNDAPRWMRIEGVGKIADLLESLTKQADTTAQRIKKKTAEAKELAAAISAAAAETKDQRR
jgi:prefoldin subunit 5